MLSLTDLKHCLTDFTTKQQQQFLTLPIAELLHQRSQFYDQLLCQLWQQFGLDTHPHLALVAVGGYGRQEMFPLSDLDILILTETTINAPIQQKLNELLALLWDCKFEVGIAVRTIDECIAIGKTELSVATNMLEGRLITGNRTLFSSLRHRLFAPDFWATAHFYKAKLAERTERYARYHNTSYNLEPDLKHSPGGLRDVHLIQWIMLRHYQCAEFSELLKIEVISPEEYQEIKAQQAVLFEMRFALHLQLKRYDNRLRFDRQLQLSEQLGYQGDGNQPVEMMMKRYFQATQTISQLSQLLLDSFQQAVLLPINSASHQADIIQLDCYFSRQGNRIFCVDPQQFIQQPATILKLFYYLTQYPETFACAFTLRQLRLAAKKLTYPLTKLSEARRYFIQLLEQPLAIQRAIMPLHQLGLLSAYLPEWKNIEGLMQFDLFHSYTVDEHTIRVMLKLESFLEPQNQTDYPICCAFFQHYADRKLLYLAALLHDIGKGKSGNHAEIGAIIAYKFAKQHQFTEKETAFIVWLVKEHLTMSITAQRRDIHDSNVVQSFAEIVENSTALMALTCLTVTDIYATNESLWNDWKRSLFTQLFQFTQQQLQLGVTKPLDSQQLALTHQLKALDKLIPILTEAQQQQLNLFWQTCPTSYFLRNNVPQLMWQAQGYLAQSQLPLILVRNQSTRSTTELFIHCVDQPQFIARITQGLNQKKLYIHAAQIITSSTHLVFDSFIVSEINGKSLTEERCLQLQTLLYKLISNPNNPLNKPIRKIKRSTIKHTTALRFLDDQRSDQTSFELFTLDSDGLLARISYIFNQLNLNLLNAKITTIGERVEDFFIINNAQQQALTATEKAQLQQLLLAELT